MGWYGFKVGRYSASVNDDTPEVSFHGPTKVAKKLSMAREIAQKAFEANKEFEWGTLGRDASSYMNLMWHIYPKEHDRLGTIIEFDPRWGKVTVFKNWDDFHRRTGR